MGRPRDMHDLADLTPREREVYELLRQGFTNSQIAERLSISLETAKHHVSEILSKLGVATREEAVSLNAKESRGWWQFALRWALFSSAALVLVALGVLAWTALQSQFDQDEQHPLSVLPGPVVYLPPSDPVLWIAPPDSVYSSGIVVARDTEDFMTKASSPHASAIIVDRDWWQSLQPGGDLFWLSRARDIGIVIVGARLNLDVLMRGLESGEAPTEYGTYPPDRNFYSLYEVCSGDGGRRSVSSAEDYLDRQGAAQFRLMLHRIVESAHVGEDCAASPPGAIETPGS